MLNLQRKANGGEVPKKATNISLSQDVYDAAKALGINISQVCERLLREEIREAQVQL